MRARGLVALAAPMLAASSCAHAFETRVPDVDLGAPTIGATIAALPARVSISELDVVGHVTPNVEWTRAATTHVNAAVAGWVRAHGGRTFGRGDVATTGVAYDELTRWLDDSLEAIAHAMRDGTDHRSVGEWRWHGGLAPWRTVLAADFVLAFRAWDAHETAALTAANIVFRDAPGHAQQTGIACLLSLADGRLVACSLKSAINIERRKLLINDANLEAAGSARTEVDYVLDGLLPPHEGLRR